MLAEATQNTSRPTDYDDVKATVTTSSTVITPLAAWRAPPLLTAVFCIIALSGFLSNTFVLVVFGKRENLRRPSSLCIINLAVGQFEPALFGASAAEYWYLHVRSYSIRCCRI